MIAPLLAVALAAAAPAYDRTCGTRAEGPPPDYTPRATDTALGRVRFLARGERRLPQRPHDGSDPSVKLPVGVRTGRPVTVRVRPAGPARLDFDIESASRGPRRVADGDGQVAVRFHACPPDTRRFSDGRPLGPWTMYPGGFLVARPGCVRLTARGAGMRTRTATIALGVPRRRC